MVVNEEEAQERANFAQFRNFVRNIASLQLHRSSEEHGLGMIGSYPESSI